MKKFALFLTALLLPVLAAAADIRYVSDQLIITLRSGQGAQYQIIKPLPSGTRLEVLEMTDTGYARVETPDGLEGWVRSQYLVKEPIAKAKLEVAEKKLARLKEQNNKLRSELARVKKRASELEAERKDLLAKYNANSAELKRLTQVAAKPILLDKQNRELKQENISLEKDLQLLQQENQVLKDRSQREWFVAGAAVLFGGMLLGLIIPKIRWRKRSSW